MDYYKADYNVTTNMEVMTERYYNLLIESYSKRVGRGLKAPSYAAFQKQWERAQKSGIPTIMVTTPLACIPLQIIKDNVSGSIIPIVFNEWVSRDVVDMFIHHIPDAHLEHIGLRREPMGLPNTIIDVEAPLPRRLKRYYKDLHITENPELACGKDGLFQVMQKYMPLAEEYWKQKGQPDDLQGDLALCLQTIWGAGATDFLVIEVEQANGASGCCLFSRTGPDEMYADIMRRSPGSHVGNNLYLAAMEHCREQGIRWLNLGIAFYNWKDDWKNSHVGYYPSLRFSFTNHQLGQDCAALHLALAV